jgi:ribosomal protein S18 acetylase RimI-like enzyme
MAAELRPARAGDVDALLAIEEAVFPTDRLSRSSFRRLIASSSAAVLVGDVYGSVAGYCIVLFRANSSTARLYSIAVGPGQSGRGIGRMLIDGAKREAGARCCSVLRLEVREDNPRAIAIYGQSGFQMTGSQADYYEDGMTAVRMAMGLVRDDTVATRVTGRETKRGGASFSQPKDKLPRRATL